MRAKLIIALAALMLPAAAAAQSFLQSSSCKLEQGEGLDARLEKEGQPPIPVRLRERPLLSYVSEQCGLAALNGDFRGGRLFFNMVDIYSPDGTLISSIPVNMQDMGGAGFDSGGTVFMYAYQLHDRGGADLFSMERGERLWSIAFPGEATEVKLSDDGKRVLALIEKPAEKNMRHYRLAMYSAEGRELWRDEFSSPFSAGFGSFSPGLKEFSLQVKSIRLGVKDGIKLKQTRDYKWDGSRLKKTIKDQSADEHKPVKKQKKAEDR